MVRLVVVPAVIFAAVSGGTFALAELHFAKPDAPAAAGPVQLGDQYRGETIFEETCAGCHGQGGEGGGIGPRLAGNPIPLAAAKATIDAGRGAMPAGLVSGRDERDVLAYLAKILG
jgi:cytochrome c551